jgi:hypothetical protein
MTTRELLHDIVDKLPDTELVTAARILTALEQPAGAVQILLANAPIDDEPDDDDFDGGLTAARKELEEGRTISHEEVERGFGLDK